MAAAVVLNTPLAERLSNVVQPKLVEVGWSTGGLDDSALAEYIILMLVNGKTQEQIATELSNDLLNLAPDDSNATDFARWLFEQVDVLSGHTAHQAAPTAPEAPAQAIPSYTGQRDGTSEGRQPGISSQDVEISEAMDGVQNGAIPTGPKSMRTGAGNVQRNNGRRMMGQISKAMDRSNDAALHRVRPQGAERINVHNRPIPKGPRGGLSQGRNFNSGIPTGPSNGNPGNRNQNVVLPQISPQQQQQMLQFWEQQMKMMSQILSPQQQQLMIPGMPVPAINPAFRPVQPQGKSLFERVGNTPTRPNNRFTNNKRPQQNSQANNSKIQQDTEMGTDDVSMADESATGASDAPFDVVCKFNLKCTKSDCHFAHQSPAAPPGVAIDVADNCSFGAACQNRKCTGKHPSPAQKRSYQSEQDCRFFPNCTNPSCQFRHPSVPICRNGGDCTRADCKFTHVRTMCRYNPCLNAACHYKHEDGQKRGKFGDKVWTADGSEKEHVSERKFVDTDAGNEELVVAGNQDHSGGQRMEPEVIT